MRGTRPSAKRQTRLNFTPIAPSSPGFEHSSQVPDRFANVRYSPASSSPLTRRAAARRELPSSGPFRSGKTRNESSFDDDDSDEDEIVAASSARRPRSRVSPPSSPTPIRGRKFEVSDREESENGEEAEDSDEDIRAVTSVRRARKHYSPPHKTDRSSAPAQNVLDSEDEDDDDEQEIRVPGSTRKKSRREVIKLSDDDNDSDEDSDDIIQSPAKRRRRDSEPRTPVRVHGRSEQDMRDLEEDLEILRNSAVTKQRTRGDAAQSAVKLRRKEQLEALRRRRAGDKRPIPTEQSEEEENGVGGEEQDGSESSISTSSDEDFPEDSDIELSVPEDLDEYEKDFVLEDDDAPLGVPTEVVDMPFEFSRHRYKRLSDHFKDVVEWMVHNKLNPAFPRGDQVYKVAFDKVTDEVMGVTGSQLLSSVWNVDFFRALQARPGIEVRPFPTSENYKCDACNRSKHPASSDIQFTGKPYLLETLEPIEDDEDEDDEAEGEEEHDQDIDREGHQIPSEDTHFYLGRFCKSKATMAHTLTHWRFHLNEWVLDYLQRKGVFADAKILEREHWSVKKRTRYANEVVDSMKEAGEVERLWRDFNLNLKTAREHGKESRW